MHPFSNPLQGGNKWVKNAQMHETPDTIELLGCKNPDFRCYTIIECPQI